MLSTETQMNISDMFSENVEEQARLANMVNKLMRKREKLLEDEELQLQPTRGLVPGPLLPTTLGGTTIIL